MSNVYVYPQFPSLTPILNLSCQHPPMQRCEAAMPGSARPTLIVTVLMIPSCRPTHLYVVYTGQMMLAGLTSTSGPAPHTSHTRPNPRREEKTVFCIREETRGSSCLGNIAYCYVLQCETWISLLKDYFYVTRE